MHNSEIKYLPLPTFVPKRNKGHQEVLAQCSVSTTSKCNPIDFIEHLMPYSKITCFHETPLLIAKDLKNKLGLDEVSVKMSFVYPLDRSSSTYSLSIFELSCDYSAVIKGDFERMSMSIKLPIRIKDVFTVQGMLYLSIYEPGGLFFEDLLDHIQKYAGVKVYPSIKSSDNIVLKTIIDEGKTPEEYLDIISKSAKEKNLGKGGRMIVYSSDILGAYQTSIEDTWMN